MKRWFQVWMLSVFFVFCGHGSAAAADLMGTDFNFESHYGQGDFLTLNLGDWPENVARKLEYLEKSGVVQTINQTEGTYATSFLDELVTFKPFFYQDALYKIEVFFPEKFSAAEYDKVLQGFMNNTLRSKLVAVYGPVNHERAYPGQNEIMNYYPFATIFSWNIGLVVVDAGIGVTADGLVAKVNIYDLTDGMKALLETEHQELQQIKQRLEALQKSAQQESN